MRGVGEDYKSVKFRIEGKRHTLRSGLLTLILPRCPECLLLPFELLVI
jgi:hypothetical protein